MDNQAGEKSGKAAQSIDNLPLPAPVKSEDPAGDLSRYTFSNPQDFLKTLAADTDKMSGFFSREISKNELLNFAADQKEEPKGRAAAMIAAKHYDELGKMANIDGYTNSLNSDTAKVVLDLDTGKVGMLKAGEVATDALVAGAGAFGTAAGAVATALTLQEGPLAGIVGGATLATAGLTAEMTMAAFKAPGRIDALAKADKGALSSWAELNGGRSA